jgi:hypothetical protein
MHHKVASSSLREFTLLSASHRQYDEVDGTFIQMEKAMHDNTT